MIVSVADAKNKLPELIRAVENGEPVTICRRGVPVVELVKTSPILIPRKLGSMRDRIQVHDEEWWKPMSNEEADAFVDGRY